MGPGDALCAVAVYGANENRDEDLRTAAIARADGALVNIVDDLEHSDFITPAIVDRDPVTVAIGTEGAAPVLARAIKADIEARLSPAIGTLARIGKSFRRTVEALPLVGHEEISGANTIAPPARAPRQGESRRSARRSTPCWPGTWRARRGRGRYPSSAQVPATRSF
jgi:DUF1009 family protein